MKFRIPKAWIERMAKREAGHSVEAGALHPEHAPSITCPRCKRTSHHPEDVRQRYCGACHTFHDDMKL